MLKNNKPRRKKKAKKKAKAAPKKRPGPRRKDRRKPSQNLPRRKRAPAGKTKTKKAAKRPKKKKQGSKPAPKKQPPAAVRIKPVGRITHYYDKVHAAVVLITRGEISLGDRLHIKGPHTDLKLKVKSLQINRIPIDTGRTGEEVGLEVRQRVREGDEVFKPDERRSRTP